MRLIYVQITFCFLRDVKQSLLNNNMIKVNNKYTNHCRRIWNFSVDVNWILTTFSLNSIVNFESAFVYLPSSEYYFFIQILCLKFWPKWRTDELGQAVLLFSRKLVCPSFLLTRGIVNPVQDLRWSFFRKNSWKLKSVNYFCKRPPS